MERAERIDVDFNKIKDTKRVPSGFTTIAISKNLNNKLTQMAKELNCRKSNVINLAVEEMLKVYQTKEKSDERKS